jgi:hypothetical protein
VARYNAQVVSAAALAANTAFAWVGYTTTVCKIRRVTLGVVAGTGAPTSQQVVVGFNPTTGAATSSATATANKLDSGSAANVNNLITAMSAAPTLGAQTTDAYSIAFNTQSGVDLPWELLEEFRIGGSTSLGIAFANRVNALPSAHSFTISVEWEE